MRRAPRGTIANNRQLVEALTSLKEMRAYISQVAHRYDELVTKPEGIQYLQSPDAVIEYNVLKLSSSRLVNQVCQHALLVCGMAGYLQDSKSSLSRHLRDALSAPLMVNNERIVSNTATYLSL